MWSGHSYLPNDSDFSHIEKRKKAAVAITYPGQYLDLMKNAKKTKPFHVCGMKKEDFVDVSKLAGNFTKPRVNENNKPIKIMRKHEMIYTKGDNGCVYRDTFLDDDLQTVIIHSSRNDKPFLIAFPDCILLELPISFKKYQNLQELRRYIPTIDREFYENLPHERNWSSNDDLHLDE